MRQLTRFLAWGGYHPWQLISPHVGAFVEVSGLRPFGRGVTVTVISVSPRPLSAWGLTVEGSR